MKVLVAYTSRHGSTAGIAERIAARINEGGLEAEARPVAEVQDVDPYEAVVLGSAAYMVHWLKEATTFARRHRRELQAKRVWLFSSGPLGNDAVDRDGGDILKSGRPKEFAELQELLQPSGDQVFFGAWDPDSPPVGIAERLIRLAPASKDALPAGDFRDWDAIDAWADGVVADLKTSGGPAAGIQGG